MPRLPYQRILVVDRDADTRCLFQVVLEAEGATVRTAALVAEALLSCLRGSDRRELRQLPVLAITATVRVGIVEEASKAGFAGCLFKPSGVEELIAAVEQLLPVKPPGVA